MARPRINKSLLLKRLTLCLIFALWLLPFALFFSCTSHPIKEPSVMVIDVSKVYENKQELKLSQFVDSAKYIKLETNPSCLFASIGNLSLGKKYLLVSNGFQGKIYLFTSEGKFIKTIGSIGKGPGEYISISGLVADEDEKYVYLVDSRQKRLIRYGIKDNSARFVSLDQALTIHGIALVNKDLYVYIIPDFNQTNPCSIIQLDQELNYKNRFLPVTEVIDRRINTYGLIKYYKNEFWLSNSVLNSLDVYDGGFQLKRRYQLENRPNQEEFFSLAFFPKGFYVKLVGNIFEKGAGQGEVTRISTLDLSGGSLYFEKDQDPVNPYNPISGSNSIVDDLSGLGGFNRPGNYTEQGYYIHHLDVQYMIENVSKYDQIDPELMKLIEQSVEEDNPIVRVLYSKRRHN